MKKNAVSFGRSLHALTLVAALGACGDDDGGDDGAGTEAGTGSEGATPGSTSDEPPASEGSTGGPTGADGSTSAAPGTTTGETEGNELPNIVELAAANEDLGTLVEAVTEAGLVDALGDASAELTVFAPTDEAFEQALTDLGIDAETLFADENAALLNAILTYHVIGAEVPSDTIAGPGAASTLGGPTLFYNRDGDTVALNGGSAETTRGGANVVAADVMASNGVVHVIDRVLLPPDIVDLARYATEAGVAELGSLAGALDSAGLVSAFEVDLLSADLEAIAPSTVFAPVDEAFAAAGEVDDLALVLQYHVVPGAVTSDAIPATAVTLATAQDVGEADIPLSLLFDATEGVAVNGGSGEGDTELGADVIAADLYALNGVVHVVDGVLVPLDLAGVALAGGFESLVAAAAASDPIPGAITGGDPIAVLDALSGTALAPLTVFAPTDEAFAAAFPDGLPTDGAAILGVLGVHVLTGAVFAADLPADPTTAVPTLTGEVTFDTSATPPTVSASNEAGIVVTDIGATNGVVHVIDTVLLPEAG